MASLTILRKQPTFRDASNSFPAKWRPRNERRNSILMTCHFPDLVSVSNWLKQFSQAVRLIRSTTQVWVVTRHQYGISALVSQTSFRWETVGGVAKCDNLKKFETRAFYSFFTAPDRTTLNLCGPPAVGRLLGQNGAGLANGRPNCEKPLSEVCQTTKYDILAVSIVIVFFDPRNKGISNVWQLTDVWK